MADERKRPPFPFKDLLGLSQLNKSQLELVLDQAVAFKEVIDRPVKKVPALVGKSIVTLFYEPSTRTRTSFGLAGKLLGADTINISVETSSVKKGETLIDTAENLQAMGVDAIVLRHPKSGAPHFMAGRLKASVINAGDGRNEHPTQGLLDIFTMREMKGSLKNKKVVIVGDIAHSRVARSNIWGLKLLGAKMTVCGPQTLLPWDIKKMGVEVETDLDQALAGADFVNVLRLQLERQAGGLFPSIREYHQLFGITAARLRKAKPDVVVLHPGPMNRAVEISSEVADGPFNVILDQVKNGVAVRMALLYLLLGDGRSKEK